MTSFSIAGLVPRTVQECTANSSVTDDAPPLTRLDTLRRRSVVGIAASRLLSLLPAKCTQVPGSLIARGTARGGGGYRDAGTPYRRFSARIGV